MLHRASIAQYSAPPSSSLTNGPPGSTPRAASLPAQRNRPTPSTASVRLGGKRPLLHLAYRGCGAAQAQRPVPGRNACRSRAHDRRGPLAQLNSRAGRYIKNCRVGDASKGSVFKDYKRSDMTASPEDIIATNPGVAPLFQIPRNALDASRKAGACRYGGAIPSAWRVMPILMGICRGNKPPGRKELITHLRVGAKGRAAIDAAMKEKVMSAIFDFVRPAKPSPKTNDRYHRHPMAVLSTFYARAHFSHRPIASSRRRSISAGGMET